MASELATKFSEMHNAKAAAPKPGHNAAKVAGVDSTKVDEFVKRLTTLEEEKQTVAEDVKELKAEIKNIGLNPKAIAAIVKLKMEDAAKRAKREQYEQDVDLYKSALGILD